MNQLETVYIGIGSNLGNPERNCKNAVELLVHSPGIHSLIVSPWYQSEPFGPINQKWFVNGVIEIKTDLTPDLLLQRCQTIEMQLDRVRNTKWGPRTMDLDILLWENRVQYSGNLVIPHPWMHLRRFVLQPIVDLNPRLNHPVLGKSMKMLLSEIQDSLQVIPVNKATEITR